MVDSVRLFAHGEGLRKYNRQRKRALYPHLEGTDVQNNFLTLPNTGDAKDYRTAVASLNAYFVQTSAPRIMLGTVFSQQIQAPWKAIRQFAITLRQASKDFDHCKGTEDQIHDEILCKCTSTSHGWGVVSWIWSSIPEWAPTSLTEKHGSGCRRAKLSVNQLAQVARKPKA